MKRLRSTSTAAILVIAAAALLSSVALAGGPVTKQNGKSAAFDAFTSICAVSGYANYGLCAGDTTKFTNVKGKVNAIQAKAGRYNLEFGFSNLTPGVEYRLWATRNGSSFAEVGRAFASESGSASYSLQTTDPAGLGFDLNTVEGDITIVTSWWSGQQLVVNPDGTVSAG